MAEEYPLNVEADDYFRTLPGLIYPQALVDHYARIANHLVELRYREEALREYFRGLLEDARGGRNGFPANVLADIQHLQDVMLGA